MEALLSKYQFIKQSLEYLISYILYLISYILYLVSAKNRAAKVFLPLQPWNFLD